MPITEHERRFLDAVSLDLPWSLVEDFSHHAALAAGGRERGGRHARRPARAPPACRSRCTRRRSSCRSRSRLRRGRRAHLPRQAALLLAVGARRASPRRLVTLQANPKALRSYNRDVKTLFGGSFASVDEVERLVGGKIVVMQGFGNPALTSLIEEWGGAGLIAVNPGRRHPLGHLHHDLGQPRPAGPAAQAEDPGGRGQQPGRQDADGAGRARAARRRSAPSCWKAGSRRRSRW